MQLQHPHEYSGSQYWNDLVTVVYVPLIIGFLHYNDLLLKVWNFKNFYIVLIFGAAEVLKYIVYVRSTKTPFHKSSFKNVFKNSLAVLIIFATFYVTAVLFGAPVFSNIEETCVFSLIVTVVTALPVVLHLGHEALINMFLSLTLNENNDAYKFYMLKIRLTLCGAWLGAVVIPLDWNRQWQDWPIPCCVASLIGYTVANAIALLYLQQGGKCTNKKTGKYIL